MQALTPLVAILTLCQAPAAMPAAEVKIVMRTIRDDAKGGKPKTSETSVTTLVGRSAYVASGSEIPMLANNKEVRYLIIGHKVEFAPSKVDNNKVTLDIRLEHSTRTHLASALVSGRFELGSVIELAYPDLPGEPKTRVEIVVERVAR